MSVVEMTEKSLEGLHGTVAVPSESAGFWKQYRAFVGPAFLVSVGYMDPGNWATDLQAGAQYKYAFLWVVALSSFMAVVMQILSARLGIVTGKDLAQACRDYYPNPIRWFLWILCEIAIGACDLAEILGSAVAIHLLFGVDLFWAVLITAFDVLLLLALQGMGMRFLEALILALVMTIGGCYFIEIFVLPPTQPSFLEMGRALASPGFPDGKSLWLAISIVGATVMPHNLYLHSALVNSRAAPTDAASKRRSIRFNTIDTVVALSVAFLVNAGIMVLAATTFHGNPTIEAATAADDTDWIQEAHKTLAPLLGLPLASTLFAVALLASGQSSTVTGTMAGQIVMEGFMRWRIKPWIRRLGTRLLAIIPTILIVGIWRDMKVTDLIVFSQVVLAMQLPFAMFPLLQFTGSRARMGEFANGWFLRTVGWTSFALITTLAVCSVWYQFS